MTTLLNPNLRRRNSIGSSVVVPYELTLPSKAASFTADATTIAASSSNPTITTSSSSSSGDFDIIPIKPISYTSLKDLIPAASTIHSPATATPVGSEISIRNHLVKQAAWAYLKPMSTSPAASTNHFLGRIGQSISAGFLNSRFATFLCSMGQVIARVFDWLLRPVLDCLL